MLGQAIVLLRRGNSSDQMQLLLYWNNGGTITPIGTPQTITFGNLSTSAMTDYSVSIPTVQGSNPYQGQAIGIEIQTTVKTFVWHSPPR